MTLNQTRTFVLPTLKERNNRENLVKMRLVFESNGTLQLGNEVPREQLLSDTLVTEDGLFRWSAFSQPIQQWEKKMAFHCGHLFLPKVSLGETAEHGRKLTKLRLLRHYALNINVDEVNALWAYLKEATPAFFEKLFRPLTEAEIALGHSEQWIIEAAKLSSEELSRARTNLNALLRYIAGQARCILEEAPDSFYCYGNREMCILAGILQGWTMGRREAEDSGNLTNWEETDGRELQREFMLVSLKYLFSQLAYVENIRTIAFLVDVALVLDNSGLTEDVEELYHDRKRAFVYPRLCKQWKRDLPYNCISRIGLRLWEEAVPLLIAKTPASFMLKHLVRYRWGGIEEYRDAVRAMSEMSA